ncbi:MAG: desaturase [Burkholderiales bacterium PBB4]|nr:MAG: desaturase [Burkholderiales bacterium PBB4]
MKIAVVGAGWAGLAAAVTAVNAGHTATVFEAAPTIGGRARALPLALPDGRKVVLDNGQHILIGAYTDTLQLMRTVGLNPDTLMLRQALSMPFVDGTGLQTPAWAAQWPAPLDALAAICTAAGWSFRDRGSLLQAALGWQLHGFRCDAGLAVHDLCAALTPRVYQELIEPLCVSALNTPARHASGQVFLRVLKDALFGIKGGSNLLLPTTDLSALFPDAAVRWLTASARGTVRGACRVQTLQWHTSHWHVNQEPFDAVIWATSASNAAKALMDSAGAAPDFIANTLKPWCALASSLRFEAITTVYALAPRARLPRPMLALRCTTGAPAQFVFDRGQLGGPEGLLAFVVSASQGSRDVVQAQVLDQARVQLRPLNLGSLQAVQTVVEKRATFACTPGLQRPACTIAPGLIAAGDYVEGPYPATLEGAVRSGIAAAQSLSIHHR